MHSAWAREKVLNDKLVNLIKKYYAYPKEDSQFISQVISEIQAGQEIRDRDELEATLRKFENDHLHLVKDPAQVSSTELYKNSTCANSKRDHIKILSFWCETEQINSRESIRIRFANAFINAMEQTLDYVDKHAGDKISIDLRGNGGGGDPEMELALYPFIEDGTHIYDYQFKFLNSPHFIPRAISKVASKIYLDNLMGFIWDFRREYHYKFKPYLWDNEIREELRAIKNRIVKNQYQIEVLIDEQTGSASELFASILIDNKKAVARGSRSKGSVGAPENYILQESMNIQVAIPAVRVWRINGEPLEGLGITP